MSFRVVARNALSMLSANVISNVLGFVVTVLLVRYLGVEGIGRYTYATTYAALFAILSNLGLYLVLTRQVAAEPTTAGARLGSVLLLQMLLAPLALGVTVGSALVLHPAPEVLPIGLAGVGVGLASLAGTYGAVVTGREKIHLNAAVNVGLALLWGLLALVLVVLGLGVIGLIMFFVVHKLAHALTLRAVSRRACGVSPRYRVRGLQIRELLWVSAPFALLLVLNNLYWNVGVILLGRFRGAGEVGVFVAAYRVIAVLVAAVGTGSGVLYPRLAHLFAADRETFALLVGRTRKYALAIGLPLGLAISLLAEGIVVVLFGAAFADAESSLRLLGWVIPLSCLYSPLAHALLAMQEERTWLILQAIATGAVIGGGLLLIPALGHLGAAGALLGSGMFLAVAVPLALKAKGMPVSLTPADLKVVGACGAMALVFWWLREVPVLALIASVAAYAVILQLGGFVTAEERLSVRTSFAVRGER